MLKLKRPLAIILALVLSFSVLAVPVFAADESPAAYTAQEKIEHLFYQLVDRLILSIGKILNAMIPGLNWAGKIGTLKAYQTRDFFPGEERFDASAAEDAQWKMGFGKGSFLTDIDVMSGDYWLAGTLEAMQGRAPVAVLDDQGVAAFALSDGKTTVAYAAVDGYGLTRGDVIEIRSRLASLAREYRLDSINVSALHQHSCIDILGLGVPLVPAVLKNPWASMFKQDDLLSGRNKTFMEVVYSTVAAAITEAVTGMESGALYYGSADLGEFIKDKRDPQVFDPEMHRLRFVPDDESLNEIWVCEAGIHPVSIGAGADRLSSDYPYYLKQYIKETTGADLVFIQGAELAITSKTDTLEYDRESDEEKLAAMGSAFGERLLAIEEESALAPLLNVAHREVTIDVMNPIHTLAGREGLLGSVFVKNGAGYSVITEIGYLELGGTLGVLLAPGEIEPAILWGGATAPEQSWTGESWDYAPLAQSCGAEKLICFGLCDDQIGYILPDNDVRSMLTENEEINAVSFKSGSMLAKAYEALFAAVK